MKRATKKLLIAAIPAGLTMAAMARHASATTYYWDTNGSLAGATSSTTATGTWGGVNDSGFWSTSQAGTSATGAFSNSSADVADFSAGSVNTITNTVSIGGNVTAGGLAFTEGTSTLAGTGTISIGTLGIAQSTSNNTVISAPVAVTGNETWTNSSSSQLQVYGGSITSGTTLSLAAGAGTIYLGNAGSSGFTGGTIDITSGTVIGNTTGYGNGNYLLFTGGTFNEDSGKDFSGFTLNGSSFNFQESKTFSISGSITLANSSSLTISGTASPTFSGALVATAAGQTLTISDSNTNGANLGFGSGANNPALVISGTTTTRLNSSTMLGNITLAGGITVLNAAPTITSNAITNSPVGLGTLHISGGSLTTAATADTLVNNVSLDGSFSIGNATALTVDGTLLTNKSTVTLTASPTITVNGVTTINDVITGGYGLTKAGTSTLTLGGANTFTGVTSVTAGTLSLTNNLALQDSTFNTNGGGFVSVSVTTPTIGGLTGSVALATAMTTGYSSVTSLTLNPQNAVSDNYTGVIANGSMAVTESGAGSQQLSGANTYTGGTTLNAGTLVAGYTAAVTGTTSSTGTGSVLLNGGTLASVAAANAYISGSISSGSGANAIAPGGIGSFGTLTVGGLSLNGNSNLDFDITNSTTHDLIIDGGALGVSSGVANIVVPTNLRTGSAQTITLASFASDPSLTTSLFELNGGATPAGYSLTLANAGQLDLTVSSVHSIISLTTTANSAYGSTITQGSGAGNYGMFTPSTPANTLYVAGSGGSYKLATVTGINAGAGETAASVAASGFSPGNDTEEFALDVAVTSGTVTLAAELSQLMADINGSTYGFNAGVASLSSPSAAFPAGQYNLFLTFNSAELTALGATTGSDFLGFDLSSANDPNLLDTLSVTAVAAVPEPTSLGILAIGAVGLLSQRKRNRPARNDPMEDRFYGAR